MKGLQPSGNIDIQAVVEGTSSNPWETHTYRPYTERGVEGFGKWILEQDWSAIYWGKASNEKANAEGSRGSHGTLFPCQDRQKKIFSMWTKGKIL